MIRLETVLPPGADPKPADEAVSIGRSATFPSRGQSAEVGEELRLLRERPLTPSPPVSPPGGPGSSPAPGAPVQVQTGVGELEIAVSTNGQNVVVAANSGFSFSSNGGGSFTFGGGTPAPFPRDGDPSLAVGASGAFYYGFIGFPDGSAAALNLSGCSTGISVSTNNGQSFPFRNHAVRCAQSGPGTLCFPDQEHIAADRVNATPGGDQVYSVWRNFTSTTAAMCGAISGGSVTPSIVCSQNGKTTWAPRPPSGPGTSPGSRWARTGSSTSSTGAGATACSTSLAPAPLGWGRR